MPDDERLGEFRKDFAGILGMIEEYPHVPDDAPGFAGALKIIDSEELLKRLNEDPTETRRCPRPAARQVDRHAAERQRPSPGSVEMGAIARKGRITVGAHSSRS
jgi:hypothetical protein